MRPTPSRLRLATADDLSLVVAIDDDASQLYAEVGLPLTMTPAHPFIDAERARWADAARAGRLVLACTESGEPVAFSSLDILDGRPFLDQVSVVRARMRQGFGTMLIERALTWSAAAGELWLTTYDGRVPWNQPMYERFGFVRVDESGLGPDVRARLLSERAVLPAPEGRIVMVCRHRPPSAGMVG